MVFSFLLALMLGFKHSYDPDHILAVSNLLSRTKSLSTAIKMSISWSAGHMLTASIVTLILFNFRNYIISNLLGYFEYIVALMLIVLGIISLVSLRFLHMHKHEHGKKQHKHPHTHENHYHKHMFGIGVIQGLASNDELLSLFVVSLTITSLVGILVGVLLFSLGVVAGMLLYSIGLNYMSKFSGDRIRTIITIASGIFSIGYGILLFFRI
jgi:hypothetical protein